MTNSVTCDAASEATDPGNDLQWASSWAILSDVAQFMRDRAMDPDGAVQRANAACALGLPTLARLLLERIPGEAHTDEVTEVLRAAESLPTDVFDVDSRLTTIHMNLDALGPASEAIRAHVDAWRAESERWTWLRAADGNITRFRNPLGEEEFRHLRNEHGPSRRLVDRVLAGVAIGSLGPVTLEGLDPPWALRTLFEATASDDGLGYRPRIHLVQEDPLELLDGLACADLRHVLGDPRVEVVVGPDAGRALRRRLDGRRDYQIAGPHARLPTTRTPATPPLDAVIARAAKSQSAVLQRFRATVSNRSIERDAGWWAERYRDALSGEGEPLRVLLPSCRFTTFVQHAARDLEEAFRASGMRVQTLIEPDESTKLTSVAHARALAEFDPDLVVLTNYTRAHMNDAYPPGIPTVCWIQDAMGHLFDGRVTRERGELDFLAGHVHGELVGGAGYPEDRVLRSGVGVSEGKFHSGPAASTRDDLECEVAFITHHSERPEAMHERLKREASEPRASRVFDELWPKVSEVAWRPERGRPMPELRHATAEAVRRVVGRENERLTTLIHRQYTLPMADRTLRRQTLEWAREVCDKRGWRLGLFGKGWENDERFASLARPALEHGEDLRSAYQRATVTIHASFNTMLHQRVLECALSGGLPLCRLLRTEIVAAELLALRAVEARNAPDASLMLGGARRQAHTTADYAELMALEGLRQRLGLEGRAHVPALWTEGQRALASEVAERGTAAGLLGDLAALTFASPEELEAAVERSVEGSEARRRWSSLVASRVRERYTHARFVRDLLEKITSALESAANPSAPPVAA